MSSGIKHDAGIKILNLPLAFIFGLVITLLVDKLAGSFAFLFFYLGGIFSRLATPDTDIDNITYQDYLVGFIEPYARRVWFIVWYPYRKIIPHRHWISHAPIISSLIRLVYFLLIIFCLTLPINIYRNYLFSLFIWNWDLLIYFVAGQICGDCIHITMDYNLFLRNWIEKLSDLIIN